MLLFTLQFAIIFLICFSFATTIRVANFFGAGNLQQAKTTMFAAMSVSGTFGVVFAVLLFAFGERIAMLITNDKAIASRDGIAAKICAFYVIVESINIVIVGALRGAGRQWMIAIVYMLTYTLVAPPVSIIVYNTNCFSHVFVVFDLE